MNHPRARGWLLVVTGVLGVLSAVGVAAGLPASERTFGAISTAVQSLMSVTLPFWAVLLVTDLHASTGSDSQPAPRSLTARLFTAAATAGTVAIYGALLSTVVTAVVPLEAGPGRWQHTGAIVVGSVLVQVLASQIGIGFGLLIRPALVAMLATIVVPLGLWAALGAVLPTLGWLTPYAWVPTLLAGRMSPLSWARWLVVALLWGGGLTLLGSVRRRQRGPTPTVGARRLDRPTIGEAVQPDESQVVVPGAGQPRPSGSSNATGRRQGEETLARPRAK